MAGLSAAQKVLDDDELLRRLMAHYTLKECAALANVTYHTVCRRARRPEFLEQLRALNAECWSDIDNELRAVNGMMTERIIELSEKALTKLEYLLTDSTDERIVAKVAIDLLDRNPETSKTTKHVGKVEHTIHPEMLRRAAMAAQEMDESVFAPTLEGDTRP